MTSRRAPLAALGAAALLALTACGADEQPAPAETTPELTCETLIAPGLADDLTDLGWEAREEPFMVGSTELDGGLQCKWGDPDGGADAMQLYAWAPVEDDVAAELEDALEAEGWVREEEESRVILTENPETAFQTDDEGYGFTYAFGDGAVTFADTKAGLDVIRWPR